MSEPRPPARPVRPGPHACIPSRASLAPCRTARHALAGLLGLQLLAATLVPVSVHAQAADPADPAGVAHGPGDTDPGGIVPNGASPDGASPGAADPDPAGPGARAVRLRVSELRHGSRNGSGLRDTDPRGADAIDTTGHPVRLPVAPAGPEPAGPGPPLAPDQAPADAGSAVPPTFDAALEGQVIGTALAFIAPRSLDPTTVPSLALWGLQGLATLDPSLRLRTGGGTIRLDLGAARAAPASSGGGASPGADSGAEPSGAAAPAPSGVGTPDVFARAFPPDVDASAWGSAAAAAMRWAWDRSPSIREAGAPALLQGFFDEIFSHLDPYSRYVAPRRAEHVRDRLTGQVGVGVELARLGLNLVLATVAANGPAAEAGLRAGERLLAVDGVPTRGASVEAVAASLVGEEDSAVRLRVAGPDGRARTLALHRAVVPPETVFAERRRGARGVLLALRITAFTADTAQRLSQELEAGLDPRVTGVVIDLRGDRGGLLRQAVTAVALLLDQGVVATTVGRDPEASRVWRVQGGDLANRLPIVVLVDGRTASAAEIMAAALADQRRAVVVGSATTGKGVVQTLTELPDGGELFVTWSRVLAPRGWPLQGLGVLPQLCTSLGAEATARQVRSLEAGVQGLSEALGRWRRARAPLDAHAAAEMRGACPAAEGQDGDFDTARALLDHPRAYAAALLPAEGDGGR